MAPVPSGARIVDDDQQCTELIEYSQPVERYLFDANTLIVHRHYNNNIQNMIPALQTPPVITNEAAIFNLDRDIPFAEALPILVPVYRASRYSRFGSHYQASIIRGTLMTIT